jgi:hypothetical protein
LLESAVNLQRCDGLIVQQEDTGVACRQSRCKSEWVHCSAHGPVAQWRGRLPYKEMTGGSSPPRTTWLGRQLADHLDSESGMLWVRLPPVLLEHASVGHWQAPLVVTQSSDRTLAVQLRVRRTDNTARSSNGLGYETLILVLAGSIPVRAALEGKQTDLASLDRMVIVGQKRGESVPRWRSGETGRHATFRMSCPDGHGSSTLPFVTRLQVRQVPSWVS